MEFPSGEPKLQIHYDAYCHSCYLWLWPFGKYLSSYIVLISQIIEHIEMLERGSLIGRTGN